MAGCPLRPAQKSVPRAHLDILEHQSQLTLPLNYKSHLPPCAPLVWNAGYLRHLPLWDPCSSPSGCTQGLPEAD